MQCYETDCQNFSFCKSETGYMLNTNSSSWPAPDPVPASSFLCLCHDGVRCLRQGCRVAVSSGHGFFPLAQCPQGPCLWWRRTDSFPRSDKFRLCASHMWFARQSMDLCPGPVSRVSVNPQGCEHPCGTCSRSSGYVHRSGNSNN